MHSHMEGVRDWGCLSQAGDVSNRVCGETKQRRQIRHLYLLSLERQWSYKSWFSWSWSCPVDKGRPCLHGWEVAVAWTLPWSHLWSFAPGFRILVVTHNKLGSTAQRERWDFYLGYVKLENICSVLISPHLSRAAAGGISGHLLAGHKKSQVGTGSLLSCTGSPGTSWGSPHVPIRCWVTGGHQGIRLFTDDTGQLHTSWRSWESLM